MLIALSMSFVCFSSCSDDDDDESNGYRSTSKSELESVKSFSKAWTSSSESIYIAFRDGIFEYFKYKGSMSSNKYKQMSYSISDKELTLGTYRGYIFVFEGNSGKQLIIRNFYDEKNDGNIPDDYTGTYNFSSVNVFDL